MSFKNMHFSTMLLWQPDVTHDSGKPKTQGKAGKKLSFHKGKKQV